MKIFRTVSIGSNFTGSYKKMNATEAVVQRCSVKKCS